MKKYILLFNLITFLSYSCSFKESLLQSNEILEFVFLAKNNSSLKNDYYGIIDGNNIFVSLPYNADTGKLIAFIETNGISIEIENITQESGITVNNYYETVFYDIIAENGNINTYSVQVTIDDTNCIDNNPDYKPYTFYPKNYECADYIPQEYCPRVPTVTAKFESNKRITFSPKANDHQNYINTFNISVEEGTNNVFRFQYFNRARPTEPIDSEVIYWFLFEIDNNINQFLYTGKELLNSNFFYRKASYSLPIGEIKAKSGCIKGVKLNDNEWQIDINVILERKKENQEPVNINIMNSHVFIKE